MTPLPMKTRFYLGSAVAMLTLGGCSAPAESSGNGFPEASLLAMASESGSYRVEVRTAPDQPPTRGDVSVQLTVTNTDTGAPGTGLGLKVVPWMPAMGHGTSVKPTISEPEPGVYQLDHLILFMPGDWQIRTELDGTVSDHVTPTLEIR